MRYLVRQRIFSLGDSFTIKNEAGSDIFIVRSQILSFGKKLRIFDLMDNELCYIEQKLFKLMPEYDVYIGGQHTANIRKKFALFRNDFEIDSGVATYSVEGNFWAHEFRLYGNGQEIARISKQYLSFSDTYGVDIDDKYDQVGTLALAIVIDMVCHNE
ncbi:uncharacterized protein YxjI [Anaerobacterium chartisolvens]|uniref:Uncharacterized protein YxjI n=1 Tax=Anaerobacterium chartisolvens TaxID=1297424 RepID=A0A369ASR7_9FIRM|nr:LURP-one-related family protein [Anaerobacterium chartisolvens]RCX12389.1 uncharacterized protein YxjI [Anaerobacterium chartisolvens]